MARQTLDRTPKFKRLWRELGIPKPHARGYLETMWDVAHESGNPVLASDADVEAAAEWDGAAGAWVEACARLGWLDQLPAPPKGQPSYPLQPGAAWLLHDYWDHAPDYVRKRRIREQQRHLKGVALAAENGNAAEAPADNGGQRRTTAPVGAEREASLLPTPYSTNPPTPLSARRTTADNGGQRRTRREGPRHGWRGLPPNGSAPPMDFSRYLAKIASSLPQDLPERERVQELVLAAAEDPEPHEELKRLTVEHGFALPDMGMTTTTEEDGPAS